VRWSGISFERRLAGVLERRRDVRGSCPSVPHAKERGHYPAHHLAQEGVPDHLDGDPPTLPLDPHPVKGPDRLSILSAECGEVTTSFELPGCLGHYRDIQWFTDAEGASLA
jgi:hypothetical protein